MDAETVRPKSKNLAASSSSGCFGQTALQTHMVNKLFDKSRYTSQNELPNSEARCALVMGIDIMKPEAASVFLKNICEVEEPSRDRSPRMARGGTVVDQVIETTPRPV